MKNKKYEKELIKLQTELIKLQDYVVRKNKKLLIIFEGRDAAGKGGSIKRFTENLNPRNFRIVALPKPTEQESGQWYFQRYLSQLPNEGEIVFFDRSWYNRSVVEPVMEFCSHEEYIKFMNEVDNVETMLEDSGTVIVKLWFEINKDTQKERLQERKDSPLKRWKISPIDEKAEKLWERYSLYINKLLSKKMSINWNKIDSNDKKSARLESIKIVLDKFRNKLN
jgi:polyphosphate kinase 2